MKKTLTILAVLVAVLAANAETTNVPAKVIGIVNAAGLTANMLQAIRQAAEKSLNVPFEAVTIEPLVATNLTAMHPVVAKQKNEHYAAMVVLVSAATSVVSHASYNTNTAVSIVNVTAMQNADAKLLQARLNKQVIRGAVFALGIPPSKDPFCVSRDYRNLDDFDKVVPVLFPPWQFRFTKEAENKGLSSLVSRRPPRPPMRQ